jgi:hypothetical protein
MVLILSEFYFDLRSPIYSRVHSWEYPTTIGSGCNNHSKHDSNHFLWFLEELHGLDGAQDLTLSASVGLQPFLNEDGEPMTDVSGFARVLHHISSPFPPFSSPLF